MRGLQVLPPSSKLFPLPFTYPVNKNGIKGSAITFFFELQHELYMKFSTVSYEKQGHSSINNWNKLQGRHSWGEAMGENGKKNECGFPFVSSQWPLCLLTIFSCEESELQNGLCAFNLYVPDMCCLHYRRKDMRQFTD